MKIPIKMHYTHNYLVNPTNPITINLIGAGSTGGRMLSELARINHSLVATGHKGLELTLYDDDIITPAHQARQLFSDTELGLYKSVTLVNRVNRFFGTSWKAVTSQYNSKNVRFFANQGRANIYITCVDTVKARFDVAQILKKFEDSEGYLRNQSLYWLDINSSWNTGQTLLSTIGEIKQPSSKLHQTVSNLSMARDEFHYLLSGENDNSQPSCSLAEELEKKDLFIDATLASMGASLLWRLFRDGMTPCRGFFLNLVTFRSEPIKAG